jgi:anti-sigma factor RsiW
VAAVVYRRNTHIINLFVAPAPAEGWRLPSLKRPQPGYAIRRWREGDLEFWAVSDAEPRELDAFHRAFEARPR